MSVVSEYFDRGLDLEEGESIVLKMTSKNMLNSYRTMLYREKSKFEKRTSIPCTLSFQKEGTEDNILLVITNQGDPIEITPLIGSKL